MAQTKHTQGLSEAEVLASRQKYGSNTLTPAKKESAWKKLLGKFSDPLIIILLVAGALSVGISIYEYAGLGMGPTVFFEPVGIFMAIILATGLGFYFEMRADKEFSILNQVNDDEPVKVMREGNTIEIPKKDVVVGDVVYLSAGDEVPADGDLIEAVNLTLDESSLTGEPLCPKTTDPTHFDKEATYPSNHVLRGTKVMEGHGIFEVTKVGDATENGKVFTEAQIDNSVKTPLTEQLDRLGTLISRCSYAVGGLVIAGRILMYLIDYDFDWVPFLAYFLNTVMIAVTLVVVSVPEGLPMAVTLSLAYSMRRMLKTNNLVRKMHACETMGAATVICTDKTGTLTQNQMQVHSTNFYGLGDDQKLGENWQSRLIAEGIAVNSTATLDLSGEKPKALGNPTEGALLLWLKSQGVDYRPLRENAAILAELPFSTERKYMATAIEDDGKSILFVKGAPEIVMSLCKNMPEDASREQVNTQLLEYQNQAMRTLGFAYQEADKGQEMIADGKLKADNLTFLGIVAISDPVREDVPEAVKEVMDAGIAVKIVTGDTSATAKEIAHQIGLWKEGDGEGNIITGPEFAALSDKELEDKILDFKVISRARPGDKKRLVETLQKKGEVVAVTGDGTNDAPALKAAHVGLSMGDGTSVAKEASDITIVDNSFASIGRAVMWGRSLYKNIQRFILFQLTVNLVACLVVLCGAFMGTESPLTVTQMLWVNLIMDTFAAMALASLPPSQAVMKDKPRDRAAFIITPAIYRSILIVGSIFFVLLIGLVYVFEHSDITGLSQLLTLDYGALSDYKRTFGEPSLTPYELSLFFTIFVFLQFWNMFNAKAFQTGRSALHMKGCGEFEIIAACILVGQALIVTVGGGFFNVVPLRAEDWAIIICGTSLVLWVGELMRACKRA
ncbi:MAG: calcium-translocating P-type ATPase, PMCA-type [Clostridium sp.]|nr:calcium-translocating P-type ATPase, PMCA-type [Clostridium sp.]